MPTPTEYTAQSQKLGTIDQGFPNPLLGNAWPVLLTDGTKVIVPVPTQDIYTTGEVLADQTGTGAVLTFTFSEARDLVWVRADGGQVRADPFGGTPAASTGVRCDDGIPNPFTVQTSSVKVYAPNGVVVQAWGFSYT